MWTAIDPIFEANVEWLAAYRHELVDPLGCAAHVVAACAKPQRLGDLLVGFPPALVRPVIGHLLWTGRLVTDLSKLLSDASLVSACAISVHAV